ncbi:MAG: hypothetical protein GF421_00135 [Candidatus Aminicenantes bacterium]|nr:hypothetical protein [Candidatus Aminicenantes bacterium]
MKRNKLLVCFLVVSFVFTGSLVLSGKKPDNTNYSWSAQIPSGSVNLYPQNEDYSYVYKDGDYVAVKVDTYIVDNRTKLEQTHIRIWVYDQQVPEKSVHVGLQGVMIEDVEVTGDGEAGVFPTNPFPCINPNECLTDLYDFVNNAHPFNGYEHIMISFRFDGDLEDIPISSTDSPRPAEAQIFFWNNFECDDGTGTHYHTLTAGKTVFQGDPGFFIYREEEDSWIISIDNLYFTLEESYCVETREPIGNSGKFRTISQHYHPLIACANMSYAFVLTRTSSQ